MLFEALKAYNAHANVRADDEELMSLADAYQHCVKILAQTFVEEYAFNAPFEYEHLLGVSCNAESAANYATNQPDPRLNHDVEPRLRHLLCPPS